MEEEEPPNLPPRISPENGGPYSPMTSQGVPPPPLLPTNGHYTSTAQSYPQQPNGYQMKAPMKPPVPNKPPAHSRPHSIHTDGPSGNLNTYPNGCITTQISDQDGFRTSRMAIDTLQRPYGHMDYQQSNSRAPVANNSMNSPPVNTEDSVHKYKLMNGNINGNANLSVDSKMNLRNSVNIQANNKIMNSTNNRFSYPNGNATSDGIGLNNMVNKNSSVNNLVARLNGQSLTSPNGNSSYPASFNQENKNMINSNGKTIGGNGQEEASTEL